MGLKDTAGSIRRGLDWLESDEGERTFREIDDVLDNTLRQGAVRVAEEVGLIAGRLEVWAADRVGSPAGTVGSIGAAAMRAGVDRALEMFRPTQLEPVVVVSANP